ncbi:Gp49 family protein [Acinetobacter sp. A47]|uniref:Gp49 family protein n=1 Tax=Acinetobacter sp. A47 TaxID=1561217 RepID=UPI0009D65842|nr:Gp49 family protein [Acinetobacter sp. A47]
MNKVTPEQIESVIAKEEYFTLPDSTVTLCSLTLVNGIVMVGKSACVDPANYDAALGEKYAREDAIRQIWPLEGYLLAEKLSKQPRTPKGRVELELEEVRERFAGLHTFISNGQPTGMSDIQWDLLHEQRQHMRAYVQVLETRLENWE